MVQPKRRCSSDDILGVVLLLDWLSSGNENGFEEGSGTERNDKVEDLWMHNEYRRRVP